MNERGEDLFNFAGVLKGGAGLNWDQQGRGGQRGCYATPGGRGYGVNARSYIWDFGRARERRTIFRATRPRGER